MLHDILRGEHCLHCGASAIGAESKRVVATTYHVLCEHLRWHQLDIWFMRCGLCRRIWPIVVQQQEVSENTAIEALTA